MEEILQRFADVDFIGSLSTLAPAVGWGFLTGIIVALVAWCVGFVIRLGRVEI